MKKVVVIAFSITFIFAAVIISCSKLNEKPDFENSNQIKETPVVAVAHKSSGIPSMNLTFEEAVVLIEQYHGQADSTFNYAFDEVWIDELEYPGDSSVYYLSGRADVTDQNGDPIYGCYSVYILLTEDGSGNFSINAASQTTYTCSGYCCKTCSLVPAGVGETDPSCECKSPAQTPSCENEARCDQTTQVTIGGTQ